MLGRPVCTLVPHFLVVLPGIHHNFLPPRVLLSTPKGFLGVFGVFGSLKSLDSFIESLLSNKSMKRCFLPRYEPLSSGYIVGIIIANY
jgi:hypothetical protein